MALGIYIHIPFCKSKCLYCDFNSYANQDGLKDRYVQALCKEIQNFPDDCEADTLYIGGGTPTILSKEQLEKILIQVKQKFTLTPDCEITVECNPATMGEDGFRHLRQLGVNRLSIGLQSANEKELKALGRIHTLSDFARCFQEAKTVGFDNLSLDLMHGLPNQTMEDWMHTLETAVAFQPAHISCYGLKLEEGTPLFQQNPPMPDEDLAGDFYEACVSFLKQHGYDQYEISNFAKPGMESRHNIKYWRCHEFAGFGAGAYSCLNHQRYSNGRDLSSYCQSIEQDGSAVEERIPLTIDAEMSEFCFLGLRMVEGISYTEFEERFGVSLENVYGETIKKNLRRETLLRLNDRLVIPSKYLYVSNSILVDFV
ncbi:MAG: oxygen-independent coproporphyrinogen III oxidase [Clostridia bacterium]|nr:oxygen-independent coproporphyrinogen III oxidase [Clostridia bacterium]